MMHLNYRSQHGGLIKSVEISKHSIVISVFSCRLPWNTKHPIGYIIANISEYTYAVYSFVLISGILSLAIGAHLCAIAMTKDIKSNLISIDKNTKPKKNRVKTFKRLCDFVKFHSTFKQLSNFDKFIVNYCSFFYCTLLVLVVVLKSKCPILLQIYR